MRQHVIADQSIHHIEGFILEEGHTAQRLEKDYGYDLIVWTYDEGGFVETGLMLFQLKASETLKTVGLGYIFDVDIRDYNVWISERNPVILILYDAMHIGSPSSSFLGHIRNSVQNTAREPFVFECQNDKSWVAVPSVRCAN